MAQTEGEWPPYHLGSRDHLHAVGVIVAAWNDLERAYGAMIQMLMPHNIGAAIQISELLGNESRLAFIREQSEKLLSKEHADHVAYFLTCAAICKENRNAIVHADMARIAPGETVIMLSKGRDLKQDRLKQYWFEVPALRQMADEIHATSTYGMLIFAHVTIDRVRPTVPEPMRTTLALPSLDKPPQPRKWHLHSLPNPAEVPPPP
jgi:hypothetical protein